MIGCDSFGAANGFEALDMLKSNRGRQVVILAETDERSLEKAEFAATARRLVPNVRITTAHIGAGNGHDPEMNFDALYDVVVGVLADA